MIKTAFSSIQRAVLLDELAADELDVLIIGGGITGAGIALDAQTRGMNVGLIDMQDFAVGTSSRSTKLIHGGPRYLKQLVFKLVAEVGKERVIVYENAPHVTMPTWMLLPLIQGGTFGKWTVRAGLTMYDQLAGIKKHEQHYMLSPKETVNKEPLLRTKNLKGGGYYVEYRTDDARLTLETVKAAIQHGSKAVNYVKAEDFLYENGKVNGVRAIDQLNGQKKSIRAKKIINAAGPWVDELREKDRSKGKKQLHLTKGVHLTIDSQRFPLQQAVYFDVPDGRMVFAIPWEGKAYIGTTDTNNHGSVRHPQMTTADRDYLLQAANFMFPGIQLRAEDVESSWAGYRSLIHEEGKDPAEISRKDEIFRSATGLMSIAGGKLTGYRKMAERIVNLAAKELQAEGAGSYGKCKTKEIHLSGGDVGGSAGFPHFVGKKVREGTTIGLSSAQAEALVRRYGANIDRLYEVIRTMGEEAGYYDLSKAVLAMLVYGIEEEMTATPSDFFIRRSGALLFHIDWIQKWKGPVMQYMAQRLHWTTEEKSAHEENLEQRIREAIVPVEE